MLWRYIIILFTTTATSPLHAEDATTPYGFEAVVFSFIAGVIVAAVVFMLLRNMPRKSDPQSPGNSLAVGDNHIGSDLKNLQDRTIEIIMRQGVHAARLGSWELDLKSGKIKYSPFMHKLFGVRNGHMPQDLPGLLQLIHADDRITVQRIIDDVQTTTRPETTEFRLNWPDGSQHWQMMRIELKRDNNYEPKEIISLSMDVTERKKMEGELLQQKLLLTRGFEAAQVVAWEWNKNTDQLTWDGPFDSLLGMEGGAKSKTLSAYISGIHVDDVDMVRSAFDETLKSGKAFQIEYRLRQSDPLVPERWLSCSGDVLRNDKDEVIGITGVILDISARHYVAQQLQESEARYRSVISAMSEGIVIHAADGSIVNCNESAERILGLTRDQMMGRSNTDPRWRTVRENGEPFPPDEHPSALAQATGKSQHNVKIGVHWPDGSLHWLSVNAEPLFDADKTRPIGAVATITDISSRMFAERQLQESEQRWRTLAENIPDLIVLVDRTTSVLFVNRTVEGYKKEDILGAPIDNFLPTKVANQIGDAIKRVFNSGETVSLEVEVRIGPKKTLRWYSCHLSPVKHQEHIIAANIRASDITERIDAEQLRVDHEQERARLLDRLELLIDRMPIGCVEWDPSGNIIAVNPEVENLFGYSSSELIGSPITKLAPVPPHSELLRLSSSNQHGYVQVLVVRSASGKEIQSEWHTSPCVGGEPDQIGAISMVIDVSERERLEGQLRQSQKMEAVGSLAGGIAHDFNNVLTAILGYTDLLHSHLPKDDMSQQHVMQIKKSAKRAAALTYKLLAFSRKQVLQSRSLSISHIVEELTGLLRRLIGENIALQLKLSPDVWNVFADPSQIEQVVMNLVVNARDAMSTTGTLTISTSNITIKALNADKFPGVPIGDYVCLSVEDTGEGIPPEIQSRIFDPFFTTKPEGKGTGLGLAVVFGIIKQSSGHIQLFSTPGQGTTFSILLPRKVDEWAKPTLSDSSIQLSVLGSETVLLVEDDDIVRSYVQQILTESGYTVLAVADGTQAIDLVDKNPQSIDLLITDVVMPVMGGAEVAEEIRKRRSSIQVLYMSGYAYDVRMAHGLTEGSNHYIQKPFTAPRLLSAIRKALSAQ